MYRFFVPPENINNGRVSLQGGDVKHISQVLRLQVGDKIHVMDGLGHRFIVQLAEVKRKEIVGRILSKEKCRTESPLRVRMGQALIKGNKLDGVVRKSVELGVHSITAIRTERCVAKAAKSAEAVKTARWRKIAREACKQCGRSETPHIDSAILSIDSFCAGSRDCDVKIIFWESEEVTRLKDLKVPKVISTVAFLAGPEGGFLPGEVDLARKHGFRTVTLGPRILKADSASPAILAILQNLWGDL